MPRHVTTGLFPVHFSGGTPRVRLFVTSFVDRMHMVPFALRWVQPDGTKATLHEGVLTVAPRRTIHVDFDDVQGRTVEVNFDIPHPAVKPTVAVVGTFLADGAEEILLFVSPDEFMLPAEVRARSVRTSRTESARNIVPTRRTARAQARRRARIR